VFDRVLVFNLFFDSVGGCSHHLIDSAAKNDDLDRVGALGVRLVADAD